FFFFFQAEDGIRDRTVTGVQTCALPILTDPVEKLFKPGTVLGAQPSSDTGASGLRWFTWPVRNWNSPSFSPGFLPIGTFSAAIRSEERRVGKDWRVQWGWSVCRDMLDRT